MIIGITGPICAGTDTLAEILKKEFGYQWIAYSDILRQELRKKGIEITRVHLQDVGDRLRKEEGNGVLSKRIIEHIDPKQHYVIGNIRNPGEVEVMRETFGNRFILIKIDADKQIRFDRLLKRRREKDPQTFVEFLALEKRDFGENEESHGQQHAKVFALADKEVTNNTTINNLRDQLVTVLAELNTRQ